MQSIHQMRQTLAEKAAGDDEYRSRLLSDPRGVVKSEFDVEVPDDLDIQVHEDRRGVAHLVVPLGPKLGEDNLAQVAGGKMGMYCIT